MSDMKCPFCQQELGHKNINDIMCSNEKCVSWKRNFYGSEDLWQELSKTKQALDAFFNALDPVSQEYFRATFPDQIKPITETKD